MVRECNHEPREGKNEKAFEDQNGCRYLQRRHTNAQEAHEKISDPSLVIPEM